MPGNPLECSLLNFEVQQQRSLSIFKEIGSRFEDRLREKSSSKQRPGLIVICAMYTFFARWILGGFFDSQARIPLAGTQWLELLLLFIFSGDRWDSLFHRTWRCCRSLPC